MGCLDFFPPVFHFSLLSPSLWETARYRMKYCLKGPLNPKQPTNQMPERPTNLDKKVTQRPALLAVGAGGVLFSYFLMDF